MTKPKRPTPPAPESNKLPDWVIEMHQHFELTGCYRAEDLNRVLGEPSESFTITPSDEPPFNFALKKSA